MTANH